jgi:hypothetical protein
MMIVIDRLGLVAPLLLVNSRGGACPECRAPGEG